MGNSVFSIFGGKYFNQNLICLILAYLGIFFAYKYEQYCLSCMCWGLFVVSMFSSFITIYFYTYEYCVRKMQKARSHKLRVKLSAKYVHKAIVSKQEKDKEPFMPKDVMGW